jgi:hypothetical protein
MLQKVSKNQIVWKGLENNDKGIRDASGTDDNGDADGDGDADPAVDKSNERLDEKQEELRQLQNETMELDMMIEKFKLQNDALRNGNGDGGGDGSGVGARKKSSQHGLSHLPARLISHDGNHSSPSHDEVLPRHEISQVFCTVDDIVGTLGLPCANTFFSSLEDAARANNHGSRQQGGHIGDEQESPPPQNPQVFVDLIEQNESKTDLCTFIIHAPPGSTIEIPYVGISSITGKRLKPKRMRITNQSAVQSSQLPPQGSCEHTAKRRLCDTSSPAADDGGESQHRDLDQGGKSVEQHRGGDAFTRNGRAIDLRVLHSIYNGDTKIYKVTKGPLRMI